MVVMITYHCTGQVTCSDGRTHCRWEAFKVMDSCNNMPGCSKGGFKVCHRHAYPMPCIC